MSQAYTSGRVRIRIGPPTLHPAPPPRRDAATDAASVDLVLKALDAGDLEGAAALAGQALEAGVRHPAPLCVLALAHEFNGRFAEAIPYLKQALSLLPTDTSTMVALARCLVGLDRPKEAAGVLDMALGLAPAYADAHAFRGEALSRLTLLGEAEKSYARALELEPTNLVARAGLASLCGHFGEHRDARAHAQAVLAAAPDHAEAALVMATADIEEGFPVTAETRIRGLIATHGPDPALSSHLGDALDAQGRAQEAFDAYGQYGEALHRLHSGQYREDDVLKAAEQTAHLLEQIPMDRWPKPSADGAMADAEPGAVDTHVFLMGFARSGTSLLGLALEGDEQVEALQEQEPLADALKHFAGPCGLARLMMATEAELAPFRTAYWRRARGAGAKLERRLFVDKQPMNTVNLPVIARLFPDARILFTVRDPRDVVLSCFRRRFLMNRYTYHLLTAEGSARLYRAAMQVADHMDRLGALRILTVRHEDLVEDFDREMHTVCAFLGLGWSDALRSFSTRVRSRGVATPSASQLTRGLNSDGVGLWRRYAEQLAPLEPYLQPWVERFGYGVAPTHTAAPEPIKYG